MSDITHPAEFRPATSEHPLTRWLLVGFAVLAMGLLVFAPLVAVFAEAYRLLGSGGGRDLALGQLMAALPEGNSAANSLPASMSNTTAPPCSAMTT